MLTKTGCARTRTMTKPARIRARTRTWLTHKDKDFTYNGL